MVCTLIFLVFSALFSGLTIHLTYSTLTLCQVFSHDVKDFSTLSRSMFSLFVALVGLIDIDDLLESDRFVGGLLFSIYIFIVL